MHKEQAAPLPPPPPPRPARQMPGLSFWIVGGVHLLLAGVLCFIPLFNLLGYESSAVLAFAVSITAPLVARGAARHRQLVWPERWSSTKVVGKLALVGWLLNLATLCLPLGLMLLNALRVMNCNILQGLQFFLLLPVAGSLLWSAVGTVSALFLPGRVLGGIGLLAAWLGTAAHAAWDFYSGPQMDSFNAIVGWIAGPVLEEVIRPDTALLFSRLDDLAWAAGWLFLAAAFFDQRRNYVTWRVLRQNLPEIKLAALVVVLLFASWLAAGRVGYGRNWGAVRKACDEETHSPHFIIHHPEGWPRQEVALLVEEHEFYLQQLLKWLELEEVPKIHSWVFPSPAEKRRLTGAGAVQFAKPWQSAIFLNRSGFPHPVLKHELAHVVAGSFGSGPLKTSARAWFWQNPGLLEGLAVALEWPQSGGSPHRLAAAMLKAGMAPPLEELFHPLGFWTRPARRAYPLAGSFVRFLLERYGAVRLRQAYHRGSLQGVYPEEVDELFTQWRKFLEDLPLEEWEVEGLRLNFGRPGVFERTCAHEITALAEAAHAALAAGKTTEAAAFVERWLEHQPEDADALELSASIAWREENLSAAIQLLAQLRQRQDLSLARRAAIAGRHGDVFWKSQNYSEARQAWSEMLAARLDSASIRLALVKLQALEKGAAGEKVLRFLIEESSDVSGWLDLREAAAIEPDWAVPWYLLGRQLFQQGKFEQAVFYLEKASRAGFSHPELSAECLRLLGQAWFRLGKFGHAATCFSVLRQYPATLTDAAWAEDWLERISFASRWRNQSDTSGRQE